MCLLQPEGVETAYSVPVLVDLLNGQNFTKSVPLSLPSNIVQDSERMTISAIGMYYDTDIDFVLVCNLMCTICQHRHELNNYAV